ncbi:DUF4270 family protein [Tenacibaculum aiptasiae]|uniref:DUF4270 family protein n=1 Tax=Tenacibaculum aiptasiae TaxID=426481 RepID=UPI0023311709|nr:DUF4270 family protein [Tenacibaculum aiptasiae]
MIRKIGVLGISLLCFAAIISCEKDFSDIGSSVVNNTKFDTGEVLLDVEITPVDIQSVRADNIAIGRLGEYWLGVYKNDNYKAIESSFVSQLTLLTNPKTEDIKAAVNNGEIDSVFTLDKVILKLPYTATNIGKETDGKPKFRLDSVLGDPTIPTTLKIFRNGTFLNTLDPNNPANQNKFESNHSYIESELLTENTGFSFTPSPKDTMLVLTRNISNGNTYKDTIKLANKAPFLAIPLDMTRMKELFWDKFKDSEFASSDAFNDYFRGLIVKSEGSNGSMVPLSLLGTNASATLDFHYTITTFEKKDGQANLVLKDTLPNTYSFPLTGVRNSIYKMSPVVTPAPANNFIIQGTAGTAASIKILDNTKLNDLRANNWLVNDATLSFYINQNINTDKNLLPQRLFIYQNKDNGNGGFTPTQITDAYREAALFGGNLVITEDKPEKYTFKITDYISELLDGTTSDISPLIMKVYNNPTDNPITNNVLDVNVKTYNWNPRGVTLLDGNEAANTTKRAVLKISYSKEK